MSYPRLKNQLLNNKKHWLITGAAGFIGSHLCEALLKLNQKVTSIDDFSSGTKCNVDLITQELPKEQAANFTFIEGDIAEFNTCQKIIENTDIILHNAAISSVPLSIIDPIKTNNSNVTGFLNLLTAAKDQGVKRFIYASSSSVYGENNDTAQNPLSPYAVSKLTNDYYANVFNKCYGTETIGLRYFNVFGERQNPEGPYAAVIPKWISQLLNNETIHINGDGSTSRDFTFIDNIVQANILLGLTNNTEVFGKSLNAAYGESTTLNNLYKTIIEIIQEHIPDFQAESPIYRDFRIGDIKHSKADISKLVSLTKYQPSHSLKNGLKKSIKWYIDLPR